MIEITCTKCRRVLRIDDGFAGGVCRCQHCKALQTVPESARLRAGGPIPKGSGLDDLADLVASSGLASVAHAATAAKRERNRSLMPWIITFGATGLAGVFGIAWMLGAGDQGASLPSPYAPATVAVAPTLQHSVTTPTAAEPAGKRPGFLNIEIDAPLTIFVLDCGQATSDLFDSLKVATVQALQSMTAEQKFQVVFWHDGEAARAIPPRPNFALPNRVTEAAAGLDSVYAFGSTDALPAITKAVGEQPNVLFLVSGKGSDLDNDFARKVLDVVGSHKVRIHTISLGEGESAGLRRIAEATAGTYRRIGAAELRQLTR